MSHPAPRIDDAILTRRELLGRSGMGMGALALGGLLADDGLLGRAARAAGDATRPRLAPRSPALNPLACPGRAAPRGPSGSSTCS